MNKHYYNNEKGMAISSLITIVSLSIVAVGATVFGIWAYMNFSEQKANVNGKIDLAVAEAKKQQSDEDEAKFVEREKDPKREFVGPDDYGTLTFNYPKTWSLYIDKDGTSGGSYEAYLNPASVPSVSNSQQYALRVTIENESYDEAIESYKSRVESGELKSSVVSANGNSGTRLDGSFSDDIRGSAVLYKIRDKTVTLRTDANTFRKDFDAIIKTIKFIQ